MSKPTHSLKLQLDLDNTELANLCGPLDENLRQLAAAYEISLQRRATTFTLSGAQAAQARDALTHFASLADQPLSIDDIQLGIVELQGRALRSATPGAPIGPSPSSPSLRTRRNDLRPRTPNQALYLENILANDITFGIGPAGTGKTYLAVACAVDALEREQVRRIVLTRPAVEAGERLGFLPGDLAQKVDPYLRPLYDALYDLLGFERVQRLFEKQTIEIAPLAYMRGRSLNHSFIILDEAQNTTPEQMKMFLTRMGFGSRVVLNGDPSQVDLQRGQRSGLMEAADLLQSIQGIAITRFDARDVVRHPLVARIVQAYDAAREPNL